MFVDHLLYVFFLKSKERKKVME